MSAQDHNKTLVMLHSAIGAFYTLGLIASPWIIAQNFRRPGQMPSAVAVFGLAFLIALLFWSTAILMHRRRGLRPEVSAHSGAIHVLRFLAGRNLQLVVYA
jgi:hypothetical protein